MSRENPTHHCEYDAISDCFMETFRNSFDWLHTKLITLSLYHPFQVIPTPSVSLPPDSTQITSSSFSAPTPNVTPTVPPTPSMCQGNCTLQGVFRLQAQTNFASCIYVQMHIYTHMHAPCWVRACGIRSVIWLLECPDCLSCARVGGRGLISSGLIMTCLVAATWRALYGYHAIFYMSIQRNGVICIPAEVL